MAQSCLYILNSSLSCIEVKSSKSDGITAGKPNKPRANQICLQLEYGMVPQGQIEIIGVISVSFFVSPGRNVREGT